MALDPRRVAILGVGKIGESLLSGLLSAGWRTPAEIVASGRREERIAEIADRYRVATTLSNAEAVTGAALVVIAVKPQDFEVLLGEIGGLLGPGQIVLSIAAAIPTARIEQMIAPDVPVVRAMPNAAATVHEGIAGLCAGAHAGDEHLAVAEDVLSHLGAVVRVPEPAMDAVTAVSGSGPAYFALLAEAMVEAGSCSVSRARSRRGSSYRRCSGRRSSCATSTSTRWSCAKRSRPREARPSGPSASWRMRACARPS